MGLILVISISDGFLESNFPGRLFGISISAGFRATGDRSSVRLPEKVEFAGPRFSTAEPLASSQSDFRHTSRSVRLLLGSCRTSPGCAPLHNPSLKMEPGVQRHRAR